MNTASLKDPLLGQENNKDGEQFSAIPSSRHTSFVGTNTLSNPNDVSEIAFSPLELGSFPSNNRTNTHHTKHSIIAPTDTTDSLSSSTYTSLSGFGSTNLDSDTSTNQTTTSRYSDNDPLLSMYHSHNDAHLSSSFPNPEYTSRQDRLRKKAAPDSPERFISLDYEDCENVLFRDHKRQQSGNERSFWLGYWLILVAIGFTTGFTAFSINMGTKFFSRLKFDVVSYLLSDCGDHPSACILLPLFIYILISVTFASIAAVLVILVAPVAAGSGIPEVKCYLNGTKVPKLLRLKTLIVKAAGVMLSVSAGLPCGSEGPLLHIGSIIAAGISQGKTTSLGFDFQILKEFRNDHSKRDFVAAGSSSGISAAFSSALGGLLMSHEESASYWTQSMSRHCLFAAMISTFTLNFFLSGASLGTWGALNQPGLIYFGEFSSQNHYVISDIPIFMLMAVGGGLIGATFNIANRKITIWRSKNVPKSNGKKRFLEVVLISALVALCGFLFSITAYECFVIPKSIPEELTSGSIHSLFCPPGQYNDMATIFFNTQELAIKQLFHNKGQYSLRTLAIFCIVYAILACVTYGISVPSGLFVPSLLVGASYGRFCGQAILLLTGLKIDPGTYALVGSASVLGGTVRMAVALTAILVETTNDISYILPIMLSLYIAKFVADIFIPGIYDVHIELNQIDFLEPDFPSQFYQLTAADVMSSGTICLPVIARVSEVLDVLRNTDHHGFPVVLGGDQKNGQGSGSGTGSGNVPIHASKPTLSGFILRWQLVVLLSKGAFVRLDDDADLYNNNNIAHQRYSTNPTSLWRSKPSGSGTGSGILDAEDGSGISSISDGNYSKKFSRKKKNNQLTVYGISYLDFLEFYPRYPDVDDLPHFKGSKSSDFADWALDLSPYMNSHPFSVHLGSPLSRIYYTFRSLGLRHMCCVDDSNGVVGLITRHDLHKAVQEHHHH